MVGGRGGHTAASSSSASSTKPLRTHASMSCGCSSTSSTSASRLSSSVLVPRASIPLVAAPNRPSAPVPTPGSAASRRARWLAMRVIFSWTRLTQSALSTKAAQLPLASSSSCDCRPDAVAFAWVGRRRMPSMVREGSSSSRLRYCASTAAVRGPCSSSSAGSSAASAGEPAATSAILRAVPLFHPSR